MGESPSTRSSLLIRIRDPRDVQAWEEFAAIYTTLIHRFCLRRGLQDADAADVAQEVMLSVSRAIGRFELKRIKGAFRSWLFTITRNCLADFRQQQKREPQGGGGTTLHRALEAQPEPAGEDLWEREYRNWMFEWACRLARAEFEESTWQAFRRTAVDHQKGEDVAHALSMSIGAVYIAKSRVLARLKEIVSEISDDPPFLDGS